MFHLLLVVTLTTPIYLSASDLDFIYADEIDRSIPLNEAPMQNSRTDHDRSTLFFCDFEFGRCNFRTVFAYRNQNRSASMRAGTSWMVSTGIGNLAASAAHDFAPAPSVRPNFDHTLMAKEGHFMLATTGYDKHSTTSQEKFNQHPLLVSPEINCPSSVSQCCLSFHYSLQGHDVSARVLLRLGSSHSEFTLETIRGEHPGNMWRRWSHNVENIAPFKIMLDVDVHSPTSYFAFDDVVVNRGNCVSDHSAVIQSDAFNCAFDDSMCGFKQESINDQFDWSWQRGSTATLDTGPDADVSGVGAYLYVESTKRAMFDRSEIYSPVFDYSAHIDKCLEVEFYYHMFGRTTGTLTIAIETGRKKQAIWSRKGQQSSRWLKALVSNISLKDLAINSNWNQVCFF